MIPLWLIANWRLVLGGIAAAIVAGVVWYYASLPAKVTALKATVATQHHIIHNKQLAIDAVQDSHASSMKRKEHADAIKKEINSAPPSADAPVAPVLRDALERLRNSPE